MVSGRKVGGKEREVEHGSERYEQIILKGHAERVVYVDDVGI